MMTSCGVDTLNYPVRQLEHAGFGLGRVPQYYYERRPNATR